jgi:hypothetical protein
VCRLLRLEWEPGAVVPSAPGLDQLQHLRADPTSTTLAVEGFKDEARGGGDISALSRKACFTVE